MRTNGFGMREGRRGEGGEIPIFEWKNGVTSVSPKTIPPPWKNTTTGSLLSGVASLG